MPQNPFPERTQVLLLSLQQESSGILGYRKHHKIGKKNQKIRQGYVPAHKQDPVFRMVKSLEGTRLSRGHRLLMIDQ
jgi:hypothetical protein